ncbi:thiamine ABC transporter substrate-binding protein [Streptomyces xiaopingdaonensis]|uniref:thiamine ABC transporter substrate-binding protein n=1 Tax=Streptomyces xiaopingdaonensis TaxID=1565415 RepID=UPI0002EEB224|nr:thiamine ABC transporter substrate-binding protein [Streptomyces xiaopingdaonensis]
MHRYVRRAAAASTALALSLLAACGAGSGDDGKTVRLVTHDSFNVSKSVLKKFTERTGYEVEVVSGGDAGAMVNQAALNKGNPQGDVLFGVDTALLSRALDQEIFTPYRAKDLEKVPERYRADDRNRVTPVDSGEICVNYDRKYFAEKDLEPPRTLDDLTKPAYRDLLVTENAATSSPGLGFLLATVEEYGEDGWKGYWKKLRANGVEVVDGWEQAYNDRFSGSRGGKGEGDRPLVVSYASSPPVEVVDAEPKPKQAPTGVASETCFRQVEFAGLLDGAENAEGGRELLDFLLSKEFQEDMPLQMFVNPVREDARLPELFTRYGEQAKDPATMAPERIADNREQWVKAWTSLVVK